MHIYHILECGPLLSLFYMFLINQNLCTTLSDMGLNLWTERNWGPQKKWGPVPFALTALARLRPNCQSSYLFHITLITLINHSRRGGLSFAPFHVVIWAFFYRSLRGCDPLPYTHDMLLLLQTQFLFIRFPILYLLDVISCLGLMFT